MSIRGLLSRLHEHGVHFSVIGGVALIARGVQRATEDLDIAYARDRDNLTRLAAAIHALHPSLRDIPKGLPFIFDAVSLHQGLNFTLDTDLGPLDLFGEVPGVGTFAEVLNDSSEVAVGDGLIVFALTLDGLEKAKRAAGRPKDLLDLGYIKKLRESE